MILWTNKIVKVSRLEIFLDNVIDFSKFAHILLLFILFEWNIEQVMIAFEIHKNTLDMTEKLFLAHSC